MWPVGPRFESPSLQCRILRIWVERGVVATGLCTVHANSPVSTEGIGSDCEEGAPWKAHAAEATAAETITNTGVRAYTAARIQDACMGVADREQCSKRGLKAN